MLVYQLGDRALEPKSQTKTRNTGSNFSLTWNVDVLRFSLEFNLTSKSRSHNLKMFSFCFLLTGGLVIFFRYWRLKNCACVIGSMSDRCGESYGKWEKNKEYWKREKWRMKYFDKNISFHIPLEISIYRFDCTYINFMYLRPIADKAVPNKIFENVYFYR